MSNETQDTQDAEQKKKRTFVEEVEVAGNNLVDRIKSLVQESNTRRVVISNTEGEELISIPLTFGVVAGGLITMSAPLLAALGAIAALVTKVKLKVIREVDEDDVAEGTETSGEEA